MDWSLFDGHVFDEVHMTVGEWFVQMSRNQVQIRVMVDRNGRYYYLNSHSHKGQDVKDSRASKRSFESIEQALAQAVKDIMTPHKTRRNRGKRAASNQV